MTRIQVKKNYALEIALITLGERADEKTNNKCTEHDKDYNKPTDASINDLKYILMREYDGKLHSVA